MSDSLNITNCNLSQISILNYALIESNNKNYKTKNTKHGEHKTEGMYPYEYQQNVM